MVNLVAAAVKLPDLKHFKLQGKLTRTQAREMVAQKLPKMGFTLTTLENLVNNWDTKTKAKQGCDRYQICLELVRKITA